MRSSATLGILCEVVILVVQYCSSIETRPGGGNLVQIHWKAKTRKLDRFDWNARARLGAIR